MPTRQPPGKIYYDEDRKAWVHVGARLTSVGTWEEVFVCLTEGN